MLAYFFPPLERFDLSFYVVIKIQVSEEKENSRLILLEDGSRFDLDQLESDQLLGDLKEWDYPIFDLLDRYNRSILSAVRTWPYSCKFVNSLAPISRCALSRHPPTQVHRAAVQQTYPKNKKKAPGRLTLRTSGIVRDSQ